MQPSGDAGALTNKLVLTKDSPIADVVYGIDNTFASRAVDEGVLAELQPGRQPRRGLRAAGRAGRRAAHPGRLQRRVRQHRRHLVRRGATYPRRRRSRTWRTERYRGLFVTPGAQHVLTGSRVPAATVARYGEDGWADYWRRLVDNDVKVTSGWSDAYQVDFTAGRRPRRPADRAVLRELAAVHDPRGRAASRRRARCSTPASGRWSTPPCSTGPPTPRAREALRRLHDRPRRSRRRCPTACTSSRSTRPPRCPSCWAEHAARRRRPGDGAGVRHRCDTAPSGWRQWADVTGLMRRRRGVRWRDRRAGGGPARSRSWSSSYCRSPAWWPAGSGSTASFDPLGALQVLTRSRTHRVLWFTSGRPRAATARDRAAGAAG